ncbi:MAG TPA: hypothetical protein VFB08_07190 [Burkholderiales bacterium]|nr:hypothetical protein [Burkholderiales bacterium]
MRWTRRTPLRAAAICIGAFVTLKIGPLAILATIATWGQLPGNPASALWPGIGLFGLAGFWIWAFSAKASGGARRKTLSLLILLGMLVVCPLLFTGGMLLALAALGITAGVLALAEMWLPEKAPEGTQAIVNDRE